MRLKLIACEIFYRELCAAVARSINQVDIEFVPKGLHDIGQAGMSAKLGELLAAVAAWVATQESVRRSERIRAGLARRRAEGKPIGGAASKRGKDKQPRRTDGYKQAWARRKADAP